MSVYAYMNTLSHTYAYIYIYKYLSGEYGTGPFYKWVQGYSPDTLGEYKNISGPYRHFPEGMSLVPGDKPNSTEVGVRAWVTNPEDRGMVQSRNR